MKKRIFWSIMLTSLLILIISSTLIITAFYKNYISERKQELVTECNFIASALEKADSDYLNTIGQKSLTRITLVSSDGTVLYDNFANKNALGNHLDRPEIQEAIKSGSGESIRLSDTLGEQTNYYALLLGNGNILRVSITTKSLLGIIRHTEFIILLIILFAVITVFLAAKLLTKTIVVPINKLDLETPLNNTAYEELSPLLLKMDKQNKKISDQFAELAARQNEFNTITENMNEALVIFGGNRHILYANKSAKLLFDNEIKRDISYLELCRDTGYISSAEKAFNGASSIEKITRYGRVYQLSVNPVKDNKKYAAVLFAIDITEKEQSEKMRREFSANVSHELKTPLTSIMGSTEIMQNGIAKKEDFPRFIDKIYSESRRLLTLIEDIIKLSRLDEEGVKREFIPVDLYALCGKVLSELRDKAEVNNINLSLVGEKHLINGIEGTLHEMIYNLCDNAIIYNKAGGTVFVKVEDTDGKTVLSVKDTGIGIAPEHQSRIFERFYRVDKSRSKETGGTGLGLSIVKHGAMLHNAEIELESKLDRGTTIKLLFN